MSTQTLDLSAYEAIITGLSDNGYSIIDSFLSYPEVTSLLEIIQNDYEEGEFKKAGIGTEEKYQVKKSIRGDYIRWINPGDESKTVSHFVYKMRELMNYINRTCFIGLKDFEMHFAVYPPGTFYKRHLDQFDHRNHRRITFICYLNPNWKPDDGGQLKMFLPNNEELEIAPTAGKLVCFRADQIEHEVLKSFDYRYSITGWMLDQLSELTFL